MKIDTYIQLKDDYSDLLGLLDEMVGEAGDQCLASDSVTERECCAFGLKIRAHAVAILRLADPPSERTSVASYKLVDFSSAMILSRTLFETYGRFVYLF